MTGLTRVRITDIARPVETYSGRAMLMDFDGEELLVIARNVDVLKAAWSTLGGHIAPPDETSSGDVVVVPDSHSLLWPVA